MNRRQNTSTVTDNASIKTSHTGKGSKARRTTITQVYVAALFFRASLAGFSPAQPARARRRKPSAPANAPQVEAKGFEQDTVMWRMADDSLEGAGLHAGMVYLFRRTDTFQNGDVVAVEAGSERHIAFIHRADDGAGVWLSWSAKDVAPVWHAQVKICGVLMRHPPQTNQQTATPEQPPASKPHDAQIAALRARIESLEYVPENEACRLQLETEIYKLEREQGRTQDLDDWTGFDYLDA